MFFASCCLFAQQPVLYSRNVFNAASYAPFGLPNGALARGGIFTVFGENLGPAQSPALAFPLAATLGGVSLSVTQNGAATQAIPLYVSATQINGILPSTVKAGLATLRLLNGSAKSNAITIQIADASPGIFAISSGGFGPGVIQNFVSADNQPINSLTTAAAPGQVITIWGTGLGPVTFPDNAQPTAGNVATPVSVTIGGQAAAVAYSGRAPCCSGVDQIVATIPVSAPTGCWVPVTINAGGVVSNTATMAIATANASSCDDGSNPLAKLVRTAGTQAFIHIERIDTIENAAPPDPVVKTMDDFYSRFYTRPPSPFGFDPYLSYPPAGTCTVHQTVGDAYLDKSLRGALPASASLSPQPNQTYNNGSQPLSITGAASYTFDTVSAKVNSKVFGMNLLTAGGSYTIDPGGPNEKTLAFSTEPAPGWTRPAGIIVIPRSAPLALSFSPGDSGAPTAILIYAYSAATNSTVEVQCLAAPGAATFTVPADILSNLPPSYAVRDGSYSNLFIGTIGFNHAVTFSNAVAANGVLLNTNWTAQSVVIQ